MCLSLGSNWISWFCFICMYMKVCVIFKIWRFGWYVNRMVCSHLECHQFINLELSCGFLYLLFFFLSSIYFYILFLACNQPNEWRKKTLVHLIMCYGCLPIDYVSFEDAWFFWAVDPLYHLSFILMSIFMYSSKEKLCSNSLHFKLNWNVIFSTIMPCLFGQIRLNGISVPNTVDSGIINLVRFCILSHAWIYFGLWG